MNASYITLDMLFDFQRLSWKITNKIKIKESSTKICISHRVDLMSIFSEIIEIQNIQHKVGPIEVA